MNAASSYYCRVEFPPDTRACLLSERPQSYGISACNGFALGVPHVGGEEKSISQGFCLVRSNKHL